MNAPAPRSTLWSGAAAVLGAVLASACCLLPLAAGFLGLGAVGFAGALEPYRPYLLGLTAVFLGVAFYQVYRPRAKQDPECCDVDSPLLAWRKRFLWGISALTVFLAAFPSLQSAVSRNAGAHPATIGSAQLPSLVLSVTGMTCAGCEATVADRLKRVPGVAEVRVSYDDGNAVVVFEQGRRPDVQHLLDAMAETGYQAVPQETP